MRTLKKISDDLVEENRDEYFFLARKSAARVALGFFLILMGIVGVFALVFSVTTSNVLSLFNVAAPGALVVFICTFGIGLIMDYLPLMVVQSVHMVAYENELQDRVNESPEG